jgi:hypothetical protein
VVVGRRAVVGSVLDGGAAGAPVVAICPRSALRVRCVVSDRDAAALAPGAEVALRLGDGTSFDGTVERIVPRSSVDGGSGSLVDVQPAENAAARLRPGETVAAELTAR